MLAKENSMIFRLKSPFIALAAALRAAWWKFRGYRVLVTDPEYMQRITRCFNCEHFSWESEQCKVCTCLVHAKCLLASEQCPKKFWLQVREKPVTINS